ncbi:hypothetical protein [Amycolatopsis japonica]
MTEQAAKDMAIYENHGVKVEHFPDTGQLAIWEECGVAMWVRALRVNLASSAATQTAEQAQPDEVTASELAGFLSTLGIEPLAGKAIGDFLLRGYRITPRDRSGYPVTETTKQTTEGDH